MVGTEPFPVQKREKKGEKKTWAKPFGTRGLTVGKREWGGKLWALRTGMREGMNLFSDRLGGFSIQMGKKEGKTWESERYLGTHQDNFIREWERGGVKIVFNKGKGKKSQGSLFWKGPGTLTTRSAREKGGKAVNGKQQRGLTGTGGKKGSVLQAREGRGTRVKHEFLKPSRGALWTRGRQVGELEKKK